MQQYQEGMTATGPNGETAVFRGGQWVVVPSQGAMSVMTKPADPTMPYKGPAAAVDLSSARTDAAIKAAQAPYAGQIAAAQAAKAQADAEAAQRNLAAQQSTASPQQQRGMANLANDEVLTAIQQARQGINAGHSAGYWARLGNVPIVGGLIEPQSAVDLAGSLNTIASRLTLDKLGQLKQSSPTGASGLGSLTEKEGALLRDSVAALGQTQSPDKLLTSLAAVEKHYRNYMALSNGEDYRNPQVAAKYGIAAMPGGSQEQPNALANGSYREEADPALKGVNDRIRSMIGAGRPAGEIVAFMNSVQPGLGDQKASDVAGAVTFRAQNPNVPLDRYPISVETRQVPMGSARQAVNAFAQTPGGALAMNALDAMTAGNAARFTDNPALARAGMDAVSNANPISSVIGNAAGGALAGAGIEGALPLRGVQALSRFRQPIADAIYGGTYGASQGGADGGIQGAAEGVLGGYLGRRLTGAAGAALRGVQNPDAQLLRASGVTMTPGQALAGEGRFGRFIKGKEDRLAGYSGIGDRIGAQHRRSLIDMNRAAFREAVPPTAQTTVDNYAEQGVDSLRSAVRDSYNRALSGRNFDLTEPQFQQDLTGAVQQGLGIPRTGPEFGYAVRQRIDPVMTQGSASGPQMQDVLQGLRDVSFGTDAMGSAANDAAGNVRSVFTGLVNRQAPNVMPQLTQADRGYRNLNVLSDAVGRAANSEGIFTPAQLGQAARSNAKRFNGPIAAATTDRPFFDLQRASQNILPSKVPDSGTAGRIEAGKGIIGGIKSAARNTLYGPLYSDAAQPALNTLLLDRPDALVQAGTALARRQRLGGLFGAPLLLNYSFSGQ